jgi:glc operon protein GlcG
MNAQTTSQVRDISAKHENALTTLDDVIASRGGNPLMVDGKVIGAIGVSGGTGSQDNVVSLAGQAALK